MDEIEKQLALLEQLRESAEKYGGALIITANGWDYVDDYKCFPNEDMSELLDRSSRVVALHES